MEHGKPVRKGNLTIALVLTGVCLVMLVIFSTFSVKKLTKTTDCIQAPQAVATAETNVVPNGEDDARRAIRTESEPCNITLPRETS